ncbi:hypothetical protein [Dictyobacter kobayashii]|uniref:Uncharacterized protein n=1 Tax=Dictyobacter kobayashii TaxID=2014872 RepID=A0A402AQF7_9CHLR|nr:hypothetical protein [Dictyobacter kobayashii]GCE21284.1 hypothetical protein KDK_50840 [Dictyobacter kobayashii]
MREVATYQEAIQRVQELTLHIRELDTLMEQKMNQALEQESLGAISRS